ncbi:MAG: DNA processing/uptake protein [Candidatus Tyloplasma litorale]|nr:MAG: DNA processing/uptake protein [Mycoplasmatales bacterium]
MDDVILYFACKYFGDWERIYIAIQEQEEVDFEKVKELKRKFKNNYLTIVNKNYPKKLRQINKPPFIIFFKGKKELFEKNNIMWYYGSYYNDIYNKEAIKHKKELKILRIPQITGFTNSFEKNLLYNIDLEDLIIVKDSGIDSYINMTKIEEKNFLEKNLIISEYPSKVMPSFQTWDMSNRIKAGLSKNLFLLNSTKDPITFKLIAKCIDFHKNIFCFNKNIDTKSHNLVLIKKGACGIEGMKEIKNYE